MTAVEGDVMTREDRWKYF